MFVELLAKTKMCFCCYCKNKTFRTLREHLENVSQSSENVFFLCFPAFCIFKSLGGGLWLKVKRRSGTNCNAPLLRYDDEKASVHPQAPAQGQPGSLQLDLNRHKHSRTRVTMTPSVVYKASLHYKLAGQIQTHIAYSVKKPTRSPMSC